MWASIAPRLWRAERAKDGELARVPEAEGINWSVQTDERLPELNGPRLKCSVAAVAGVQEMENVLVKVLMALAVAGLMSVLRIQSVRTAISRLLLAIHTRLMQPAKPSAAMAAGAGAGSPPGPVTSVERMLAGPHKELRGVSGFYEGQSIPLGLGACVIGRDGAVANLVVPSDSVSKRHCQVRLEDNGRLLIEDLWSSNGTFLATGERLTPNRAYPLRPGDRFFIGGPENTFEITARE